MILGSGTRPARPWITARPHMNAFLLAFSCFATLHMAETFEVPKVCRKVVYDKGPTG